MGISDNFGNNLKIIRARSHNCDFCPNFARDSLSPFPRLENEKDGEGGRNARERCAEKRKLTRREIGARSRKLAAMSAPVSSLLPPPSPPLPPVCTE